MDLGLKDKIALVTGAASGIGKETTRTLLEEGATVVMTDYDEDNLKKAAQEMTDSDKLLYFPADIRDLESLSQLHDYVKKSIGTIDILVQNAGVTGAQGMFHTLTDEDWVETIDHDFLGPVRVVREFLPDLRADVWGRIILISSENAVQPYDNELPYDSAKAAILSFAKGLSRSYAKEGLLVNTVSPAFIETPMTDRMMTQRAEDKNVSFDEAVDSFLDEERPHIELKRRGQVEEVAAVIAFLCSKKASFVNGANYRVDGGSVATI
ncbi:SDR family NAD(P)-dependent oxidoreductase [Alkalibacterium kapii]|uniref:Ketoacyl reductase n=1 Tax=Alkalibacterium kapii TaxID=426704 RepID=A0A511AUR7_9LACT|nr:SDR family oxidoreductase [Alkalibacterium kapii]GEK91948.1 ketoacyl reductase [Alkalibacterium kapii]